MLKNLGGDGSLEDSEKGRTSLYTLRRLSAEAVRH